MDINGKKNVPNKYTSAGLISKLLFLWIIPLFRKGNTKDIDVDDLNDVPADNLSGVVTSHLQREWDTQCEIATKQGGRPKLLRALLRAFGSQYALFVTIFMFDTCVIRIVQPIFLKLFIRSFNDDTVTFLWQFLFAGGICLTILFHLLLNHPTTFQMNLSGMRCRVATSALIYRKTLRLSRTSQGQSNVGQIVNLLSNDVSRFDYNLQLIAFIFVGPVQTLLFFYLLWEELGLASVAGMGYVLLLSPSQYVIGKLSGKFRMEIAQKTDERSRIMSEIIVAIRLIKMYAWEKPFSRLINKIRALEFKALRKRSYMRASFMGVYTSNFTFVPFLAILAYALLGNDVTPDKAFFAVAIFNAMTEVMMYFIPTAYACIGELLTSLTRIEDFLLADEQVLALAKEGSEDPGLPPRIQMNDVCASWDSSNVPTLTLDSLSIAAEGDQLVMIVGPVGSGKTSLLQLLIQELPATSGTYASQGRIAYASQESWIFPGSIRQNILFGRAFHASNYSQTLDVCALEEDLKQFPYGDSSVVGERGVALSGGQKARINLARALYQDAEIYLMDDPLSAVDSAVSRHIFERCIKKHLSGRLRILVTHQLQYLPQADHVVVLDKGKITAQGTYTELCESGIDFVNLLAKETDDEKSGAEKLVKADPMELVHDPDGDEDTPGQKLGPQKQKLDTEIAAKGNVSAKTYWNYFRAGDSIFSMTVLAFGFVINQILITSTDYWLCIWTTAEEAKTHHHHTSAFNGNSTMEFEYNDTSGSSSRNIYSYDSSDSVSEYTDRKFMAHEPNMWVWDRNFYMTIYISLALSVFLVDTTRALYLFMYTMKISNNIHDKMFRSLVKAPIKFFDENPSGRIMNRFTKDIGALDEYLPLTIFDTLDIGFRMLGILVVVITSNYFLILPIIMLITVYGYIRQFYVRTARNIKRVEAIARSPLYTHLASSIHGLTTIRSSKSQNILIAQFDSLQDTHSAAWYHFVAGTNWFSMFLELTSTLFITVVTYSFLGVATSITSGQVGLAMASLLQLMTIFQFGMRQSAETENLMTSVERTLEYTNIPSESSNKNDKSTKDWPRNGSIKFNGVSLTYDGRKDVLRNLSFEIHSNEKIGICGRTGAGKSSLISSLFKLAEISGSIYVDGRDISEISLKRLRRNISIIPQDPVLFSGTIRYNLDPFDKFSDDQIWQVLQEVELRHLITALDFKVTEEGSNFSVGQRQLVCLARAILRRNKILVLDEATANVDPRTDSLIQQTIRQKFADCTIVTIAHRLQSVMDCDRIMVLDNGSIMEYDHPHILLQNLDGHLSNMVRHTGSSSEGHLREFASKAYDAM